MSYGTWNTIMSTIMTGNSADVLKDAQERQAASRNKNKVAVFLFGEECRGCTKQISSH